MSLEKHKKDIQEILDSSYNIMSNILDKQTTIIHELLNLFDSELSLYEDLYSQDFKKKVKILKSKIKGLLNTSNTLWKDIQGHQLSMTILERRNEVNKLKYIKQAKTLENKIEFDALTGLRTRLFFEDFFKTQIAFHQRKNLSLTFFMVDLDHFKEVNDTYGHQVGDTVLEMIGHVFKSSLRESDVAARYGGDEFMILFQKTNIEESKIIARRLHFVLDLMFRSSVDRFKTLDKMKEDNIVSREESDYIKQLLESFDTHKEWTDDERKALELVTVSIGGTELEIGDTITDIIKRADQALYNSKYNGRNKVSFLLPNEEDNKTFQLFELI